MGLIFVVLGIGLMFWNTLAGIICAVLAIIISIVEFKQRKKFGKVSLVASVVFFIFLIIMVIIGAKKINKIVDKSKDKATQLLVLNTVRDIKHSAQRYYYEQTSNSSNFKLTVFWCNGEECISKDGKKIVLYKVPTSGTITIDGDGIVKGENLIIDDYICYFSGNEEPNCE